MTLAVCPGSFDPVTNGHLDIIARASRLFGEVIVAVGINPSKNRMFGDDERMGMIAEACSELGNVRVDGFTGLITDYCAQQQAVAIVKGLRGPADFDYELPMAQMNSHLTGVETVFIPTSRGQGFISSSLVKEVAGLGGDITGLVPNSVRDKLLARIAEKRQS